MVVVVDEPMLLVTIRRNVLEVEDMVVVVEEAVVAGEVVEEIAIVEDGVAVVTVDMVVEAVEDVVAEVVIAEDIDCSFGRRISINPIMFQFPNLFPRFIFCFFFFLS